MLSLMAGAAGRHYPVLRALRRPAWPGFHLEFGPENLEVLNENLRMNPSLSARVSVVPLALWNQTGTRLQLP